MSVFIIAEAGVNHNGDPRLALDLVDAAAGAGADAVKFQTFKAAAIVTGTAGKAAYQRRATGGAESQQAMLTRLELDEATHRALMARCAERDIAFLSTPFDLPSLRLLVDDLGLDTLKISSGEITNAPLLLAAARAGRRVILSTGASTLGEVEAALGVLAFGYAAPPETVPAVPAFAAAWWSDRGRAALAAKVSLLHCTSEYPAPPGEVNLRAMDTLAAAFGLPVGLSDHTEGIAMAVAAVARGAAIIEKHFTLDRSLPGPDHGMSLEPGELAAMVAGIRAVELALGDGVKHPAGAELGNRDIIRKVVVAARPIRRGALITEADLTVKRAGTGGLSPMQWWSLLGRPADRDYAVDDALGLAAP